jgi:hypothetical protein
MTPIQQLMLGVGAKKKTYLDDVFSTDLYTGNSGTQSINNGINLAGEGGLVWNKNRSASYYHSLIDTVRGKDKVLYSNETNGNVDRANGITSFNANGYTLGSNANMNDGNTFASWSFRKAPGFFDIVTWTGNGSVRNIAHSLGSVPGSIWVKRYDGTEDWTCYHRSLGSTHYVQLNKIVPEDDDTRFNDTDPTSTHFTVDSHDRVNRSGWEYVAYIFAGGESTAATARSVDFTKANSSYLSIADNNDFDLGTGDFTVECWVKVGSISATSGTIFMIGNEANTSSLGINIDNSQATSAYVDQGAQGMTFSDGTLAKGQWRHIALTKSSNVVRYFVNGISSGAAYTQTNSIGGGSNGNLTIGASDENGTKRAFFDGEISNFRIIKGTALYTSSFRPTYEPLTNVTNTKLLCCNNSSTTGSTVTPGTITASGSPTASTDSPFDDLAAFTFGESGSESVIKTGSYVGNGSATGPEINLGWEPQWVLFKNASSSYDWRLYDSMRGIVTGGQNDSRLMPNSNSAEETTYDKVDLTSTGFKIVTTGEDMNQNGQRIIYIAIRRPDGYVGKPVETATSVFAMDTGNGSSTIPTFDSSFPVDFALNRNISSTANWYTNARMLGQSTLFANGNDSVSNYPTLGHFDSNLGWAATGDSSSFQSWMWKRHAGFDVVTYKGNNTAGSAWSHNLGKIPEMIWIKNRSSSQNWAVGHIGLNGGTNPWNYRILLNSNNVESAANDYWGGSSNTGIPPTSIHFFLGSSWAESNANNNDYIAMLFSSVDGISKVGSYTGNGTSASSTQTITLGFQPRFLIVKGSDDNGHWNIFDTTRGWGSGTNDAVLELNQNGAQSTGTGDVSEPTSTGFTVRNNYGMNNKNNKNYIYYAHA